MNILNVTGIITAIATLVAAITSIFVIARNNRVKEHILKVKLKTFMNWFSESKVFCEHIFEADEKRRVDVVYSENLGHKPNLIKNVSELMKIREEFGYVLKHKDEVNLDRLTTLLSSYIYLFDFFIHKMENEGHCFSDMEEFLQSLKLQYPRRNEFSPNQSIGDYVFNIINEIEKEWKCVEENIND